MIIEVGNIIIGKINGLPFIDKYAGVVKPATYSDEGVKKTFPISCALDITQCKKGDYMDLCPDSSKKSVLYLEDKYIRFVSREGNDYRFQGSFDLVCWLNLPKLGLEQCSVSAKAILSVMAQFSATPANHGIYQKLLITPLGQNPKSINPFAKYSYDESVSQFLLYPFDYFVLPLQVDFVVNKKCVDEFLTSDPIGCLTPAVPCCDEVPVPSPYLTCTTLSECLLIRQMIDRIEDLETRKLKWTNLTAGYCDGSNVEFTFAQAPEFVFYNKVILLPSEYTVAGNVVTLNFVPYNGESIAAQATY